MPSEQGDRSRAVVATLAFTGTVAAVMQTIVTPLIAQFPAILHTSAGNAAWVITVTLLTAAVAVPIAGRLGDMLGKRRMLLACCVPLFAGSVVCALSSSIVPMVVGRGLQGMGMGMVPLGIALLRDVVPRHRLSSSIALVSASMGIGGGIGLPIAAGVAQYASWRDLFWGSAALAGLVFGLIWVVLPEVPGAARGERFDVVGAGGLAAGLVCLLLAVSQGSHWGWASGATLALLAAALVVLAAWGWWELRCAHPIVDLRTTARPRVLLTNVASIFVGVAMFAQMMVIPQILQLPRSTGYGLGQDLLATGLWMAPAGVVMMVVSPLGGRLIDRRGPRFALVVGVLVIAAGYVLAQALMSSAWGLLVVGLVVNTGVALAYGAMPALIMGAVPASESAAANGFNTLMRSIGTTTGAAVIGVVLAQMTTLVGGVPLPSQAALRVALAIGGGVALLAAAIAATIPVGGRPRAETVPAVTEDGDLAPVVG